jgi:26S proteasome regulatory subunit N1
MSSGESKKPDEKKQDKEKEIADLLPEEELNEEDQALKDKLELCVERLSDRDAALRLKAYEMIKTEITEATTSMTSVPKPLKFLTPLYSKLVAAYKAYTGTDPFKKHLSDLCSVIAMVAAEDDALDMLEYCLSGSIKDIPTWGHEYLRALSGQLGKEYDRRVEDKKDTDDLMKVVDIIVPQFIDHNEEPEAVDLMMETEALDKLNSFCNARNFDRVCRYLCSCSQYAADTEEMIQSYTTAYTIYKTQKSYPDALRVAQKMNNMDLIEEIMKECTDPLVKK